MFASLESTLREKSYFGYEVTNLEYELQFILSQLISSITTFYFKNKFSTESLQGETSHTYPKSVRALPIAKASLMEQKKISIIAKKILEKKLKDKKADVTQFENEIDHIFYDKIGRAHV